MESDLMQNWRIACASGIWFALASFTLSICLHLFDADNFGTDPIMITIYAFSSLIVGGFLGTHILKSLSNGPFLFALAKMSCLVLISELVIISIIASLVSLVASRDIGNSLLGLVLLGPIILVHFGLWKFIQIIATVYLLFLGQGTCSNREDRRRGQVRF
jgi:hypothetical protein